MMDNYYDMKEQLFSEAEKLHKKYELSQNMAPDFFEPIMLEYLDKFDGVVDKEKGEVMLSFDSRGTRYDGRTEQIENVRCGEEITIVRDPENRFNPNNFMLFTAKGVNVGNMPAELCNVIAPLYDAEMISFINVKVSFVDPISKRSRYAKQATLFVELSIKLL